MSSAPLGPGWVSTVPVPYRSLAASLETHYRRLVGDPDALHRVEVRWRADARRLRSAYQEFDTDRAGRLQWTGGAAQQFDLRADRWSGAVSGAAAALDFAAEGLRLAATQLPVFEDAGRRQVLAFVKAALQVDQAMQAAVAAGLQVRFADFADQVVRYARAVQANLVELERQLDHLLASMPRRFQLGPDAPWRREIPEVFAARQQLSGSGRLEVELARLRPGGRLAYGTEVARDVDGNVLVSMSLTPEAGVKAGLSLDDVKRLGRVFEEWEKRSGLKVDGGVDGRAVLAGSPRITYSFRTEDDARRFLEQTGNGDNPFAAVLADGGGLPHEIAWQGRLAATGHGGVSVEGDVPVRHSVEIGGTASADASATAGVQSSLAIRPGVGYQVGAAYDLGADARYGTGGRVTLPGGVVVPLEGFPSASTGGSGTRTVTTVFDTHGHPVTVTDSVQHPVDGKEESSDHPGLRLPLGLGGVERTTTTTTERVATDTRVWDVSPTRVDDLPTASHVETDRVTVKDTQKLEVGLPGPVRGVAGVDAEHTATRVDEVLRDGWYTDAQGRHPVPQDYPFTDPPDHTRHPGTASDTPGRFPRKR